MAQPRVDFRVLHARLVSSVRARVRNGEISERGLARLTGISQPHIHNVLKGARLLSPEKADQIMDTLRIDLTDLLREAASDGGGALLFGGAGDCCMAPMLDGWIGPDRPYPLDTGPDRYPFSNANVESLKEPVAAKLAPDPSRAPMFRCGGVVLLDCAEPVRLNPGEQGCYALDLSGSGTIGQVRVAPRQISLYVWQAHVRRAIRIRDRHPLDVIRGRVKLFVQYL